MLALLLSAIPALAQDTPTLSPLETAQLRIVELEVQLAQTRQAMVRCEADGPQWQRDMEQTRARAKDLVLQAERDHPGWTLDLTTKALVKK